MTATQLYAKMVQDADRAGATLYERIADARRLLADREWVESPSGGGGSEDRALDRIESRCFASFHGAVSLTQMLDLLENVPDVKKWQAAHFDLGKLWHEWKAQQQPKERKRPRAPRQVVPLPSPAEWRQETPAQQGKDYEKAGRYIEALADKVARLEAENAGLRQENQRLKDEIKAVKAWAKSVPA